MDQLPAVIVRFADKVTLSTFKNRWDNDYDEPMSRATQLLPSGEFRFDPDKYGPEDVEHIVAVSGIHYTKYAIRLEDPPKRANRLQDRIAKLLLVKHGRILSNKTAKGEYWTDLKVKVQKADQDIIDSASIKVKFASGAKLVCEVADSEKAQIVGLQKYASLPDGYGMIFPYDEPRQVTFHMGKVPFPIDIMFVGSNGRINKIVEHAEPGTRERWGMSHVLAVIEATAGFCKANKIEVGTKVDIPLDKDAQMNNGIDPLDRFKGHDLVDNQLDGQSVDPGNFSSINGHDPMMEMADDADPTRSSP